MSIRKHGHHGLLIFFLFISGFCSPGKGQTYPPENQLPDLLLILEKEFAEIEELQAEFEQRKQLKIFSREILLTGSLMLRAPDYFRWEVKTPVRTTVTARADGVEIWDEESGTTQKVSISDNPIIRKIWSQIDAWFRGRYSHLQQEYQIKILQKTPLQLQFKPLAETTANPIAGIVVDFAEDRKYLRQIRIMEKGGDFTVIKFKNIKIKNAKNKAIKES